MEYQIGDIIKLKKPHPCGSQEWEILRVVADFRLKCMGCGHQVRCPGSWWRRTPEGSEKPEVCNYSEQPSHLQIHSQNLHFLLDFQQEIW